MSESNEDTTADEQTVAELKERIGELEERVEQQENQGPSRRQFLGSLTGIASAGAAGYYFGSQRASAAPSWGAASGQMGTQSKPLSELIAQTGTFESVSTESVTISSQPFPVNSNSNITVYEQDRVSVASGSYATIFDSSQSTILHSGSIYGYTAGIKLTVDGTVKIDRATAVMGEDNAGDLITTISVPTVVAESSMKLETYNDSGSPREIGWRVFTE